MKKIILAFMFFATFVFVWIYKDSRVSRETEIQLETEDVKPAESTKKIIFQEAKKNNISVTDSDIQNELDLIRSSVAQQGATLEDILAYQGMTHDQLVENVKIQKILEQLLKDSTSVSDDEIKARYDENRDIYGKDKTYEQLKEDIRYQIYQEKVTASYKSWIDEKVNSSEIYRYL